MTQQLKNEKSDLNMRNYEINAYTFKYIPRLSCRVRDQNYMNRKLKRQRKTGLSLFTHLVKLTFKHWFK